MERLPVNSCDNEPLFEAKLAGAYDRVAKSQYLAKKGKSYFRSSVGEHKYSVFNRLSLQFIRRSSRSACSPETCHDETPSFIKETRSSSRS